MKYYCYKNAKKLKDFFGDEFLEKLDLKNEQLTNLAFNRGKRVHFEFVRAVFVTFMKQMIKDCMENNVKFIGPGKYWFYIFINKINNGNFNRIVSNKHIYKNVNLISSDFNIYEFNFYSVYLPKGKNYRRVRIDNTNYQQIVEKVNEGKRYSKPAARNYRHYVPYMKECFPALSDKQIDMIIREGCFYFQKYIVVDKKDLLLRNSYHKFSMTVYNYVPFKKVKINSDGSQ